MLRIKSLLCLIALASASRLLRRELEASTDTVCINWFGNMMDWDSIPFEGLDSMSPWGYTPEGCTEAIVEPYGAYGCATYDIATNQRTVCFGDCFDGACVVIETTALSTTAQLSTTALSTTAQLSTTVLSTTAQPSTIATSTTAESSTCINWFGNNLDWNSIPFESLSSSSPWGLTPEGCTEALVEPYGSYSCATMNASGEKMACSGDCFDGVCVDGYESTTLSTTAQTSTTAQPVICFPGTTQDGAGCVPCPAGYYNANLGGSCSPCPEGTYSSEDGSITCTPCEVGFVAPSKATESCEMCPDEFTTAGYGQIECILDEPDHPTATPTSTGCDAGLVQDATDCFPCAPGNYEFDGACHACSEGTYASVYGSTVCMPCEVGYIAPYAGSQYCEMCPEGYTTNGEGQHECVQVSIRPTASPVALTTMPVSSIVPTSAPITREPTYEPEEQTTTSEIPTRSPTASPSIATSSDRPTGTPTFTDGVSLSVIYDSTRLTCTNKNQKISQPCNGNRGTGCDFNTCAQHCIDEAQCNFFFHIKTNGCILYSSCDKTRKPAYSGTTVEVQQTALEL